MKHVGLTEQTIGLLFLVRAISFVLACIIIPYFKITPKLQHLIGLLLQCLSLHLKTASNQFYAENYLEIVVVGLILQGISSPMIMISVIPSLVERYQYDYNIHSERNKKIYTKLTDCLSNILELMFSLFQIIGFFSGSELSRIFGYSGSIHFFIALGLGSSVLYGVLSCGKNYKKEYEQM